MHGTWLNLWGVLLLSQVWGCAHSSAAKQQTSSKRAVSEAFAQESAPKSAPYTRRTEATNGLVSLEVALRRFVPVSAARFPVDVWLVGVTHLGTSNYYGRLQQFLDGQEVVLFEGIGATNGNFRAAEAQGFSLQPAMARALGLRFQLFSIDYQRPNWVNSDLGVDELERQLPSNGSEAGMAQIMALFQGEGAFGGVARLGVALVGASSQLKAMARLMLIETLGGFEGELPGSKELGIDTQELMRVLIEQRNAVVVRDLRSVLRRMPKPRSVAIFYGAGHMVDLERRVVKELGLRAVEDRWLRAFSVDLDKTGMSAAEVAAMRESILAQFKK